MGCDEQRKEEYWTPHQSPTRTLENQGGKVKFEKDQRPLTMLDVKPLRILGEFIRDWRAAKGFETPGSITEVNNTLAKLMLVVTEVAEAA